MSSDSFRSTRKIKLINPTTERTCTKRLQCEANKKG